MSQVQVFDFLAPIAQICRKCNGTTMNEAYVRAARELCRRSKVYASTLLGATTAPFLTPYTTGTVTVTNGSAAVTGSGTSWLAQVAAGDTFTGPNAVEMEVESVTSNTALVLTATYAGGTLGGQAYSIGRDRYVSTYSLGSDAYAEIIGVRAVSVTVTANIDIRALDPLASGLWDLSEPATVPEVFAYVPEAQLALHPKPDAAYDLAIALVLQPKRGVNSIEEDLVVKWEDAFRAGALAYLLRLPGMAWTDKDEADRNAKEFERWIDRATVAAELAYADHSWLWTGW